MRQDPAPPPPSSAADSQWARLVDDYLARRAAGEVIGPSAFAVEHPEGGQDLRSALSLFGGLHAQPNPLDVLRTRGVLRTSSDPQYAALLDDYGILAPLGVGGMGIVLKAHDPAMRRVVAIKVLLPTHALQAAAVARFRQEAHAAARLQHPNVVTIHTVGQSAGVPYLVMEYVGGMDLGQFLRSHGPLRTSDARQVFGELLTGLAAAHAQGIIHRDIKPANILLTSAVLARLAPPSASATDHGESRAALAGPWVKLADFGLARCAGELTGMTAAGALLGTPECMSPEQVRGDQDIDERTDLYSAGVVAYQMLTGRPPFQASTVAGTLQRILNEPPPDATATNRRADPVLSSIARRLMAPARSDRFQSAAETLAALRAGRPVRPVRRRGPMFRRIATGVICAALAATGLLVAYAPSTPQPIRSVSLDRDTHQLSVWYGHSSTPSIPPKLDGELEHVRAAALLDIDGRGTQRLAVGPWTASRTEHVYLLDASGKRTDALFLGLDGVWPGFSASDPWLCRSLAAGPLDSEPGDELVAATAHHTRHPGRVSIIDPRVPRVRSNFWHPGHIDEVHLVPDFFGPGQTAIFACGCNEQPNEFPCTTSDTSTRTDYDVVYVFMILDPRAMVAAQAPPLCGATVPPPGVYAYAYADMPIDVTSKLRSAPSDDSSYDAFRVRFKDYNVLPPHGPTPAEQRIQIGATDEQGGGIAILTVNGDLDLLEVQPTSGAKTVVDQDFFRSHWRRRVAPSAQSHHE